MGFSKGVIQPLLETTATIAPRPPEVTTVKNDDDHTSIASCSTLSLNTTTFSSKLRKVKREEYSLYAAKALSSIAAWSYSDHETFKDMVADMVGPNAQSMEIQVKNQPLLVEATAQVIRTSDKKVMVIAFRGTEMTNLINWMTDAIAKKSDFDGVEKKISRHCNHSKLIQVHTGFKKNFNKVWYGKKGILMHLLYPEMMDIDYDYTQRTTSCTDHSREQDQLEAIYICGHSLGGAMAFLAGLRLAAAHFPDEKLLFSKLRGIYTYGSPMIVGRQDREFCERLVGNVTFRHVHYNDIVPHLPPLSTGTFDHVGVEYRYHPRHGWRQRHDEKNCFGLLELQGRCTQVPSILFTGFFGLIDGILDQINWLSFFRGEDRDLPVIGCLSRGYLKMWWSFLDHLPGGYVSSLETKFEAEEEDWRRTDLN